MFKKVLVPLDGSSLAQQALPYAEELALRFKAEVYVLVVVSLPAALSVGPEVHIPVGLDTVREYELQQADSYLEPVLKALEAKGIVGHAVIREGKPADIIVDFAQDEGMDIVIMCTHGRSGISRWIFGSVTQKVLQKCRVPVLVIKPHNKQ